MLLDPALWPKLHGASTHFPIALTMVAAFFEALALVIPRLESFVPALSPHKVNLRIAAYYAIIVAALGTIPAVISGLFLTQGEVMGHGALLFHHLFVWPAFTLLVILGVWRALLGEKMGAGFVPYLAVLFIATGLISGAGYWGGEMIAGESTETPPSIAVVQQGRDLFVTNCVECHGDDARGDEGPDLHNLPITDARIKNLLTHGVKDEMPNFSKKFNDDQQNAIVAYIRTLK